MPTRYRFADALARRTARLTAPALLLPLVMCWTGGAWAEDRTIEDVLASISAKAGAVESWSADVAISMSVMGMDMNFGGQMKSKGALSWAEFDMNVMGQSVLTKVVTTAEGIMWTEMTMGAGMQMVTKAAAGAESGGAMGGGSSPLGGSMFSQSPANLVDQLKEVVDLSFDGEETMDDGVEVYVLSGKMDSDAGNPLDSTGILAGQGITMGSVKLHVGKDDGFPRRVSISDRTGAPIVTMQYIGLRTNIELDDALFQYTPPEGVQVMDMSDVMNMVDSGALSDLSGGGAGLGAAAVASPPAAEETEVLFNAKFKPGDMAPEFDAPAYSGGNVRLADYRGKVVFIDFWATWCVPCIKELPHVTKVFNELHPRGLEIIGVSLDSSERDLKRFMNKHAEVTWPQVFDGKGWGNAVGQLYEVEAIPFTLILDAKGKIRFVNPPPDQLKSSIEALLVE